MRFTTSRGEQAARDAETVLRVRAAMDGYTASHGPEALVSVAHVRDLLNPRGMWSLDPERRRDGQPPETPEGPPGGLSPTADPMTGCEPVTAPRAP